ncbi:MAG: DUF4340 domain-containing protein [Chloroflexi bacterium]|nr:DUF4340 domain-containing protein [Chloroflexota bacterium]
MKLRNTIILLAVMAALGAYVLLFERGEAPTEGEDVYATPTQAPAILVFEPSDVRVIRVDDGAGSSTTELTYADDGLWRLTAPVEEEADQPQVIRFVETMANLQPQRELTGTVGAPAEYGLDSPTMRVQFELADGTARTLSFGARTPAGSGYYAQVDGDEHIYVVPLYIWSDAERLLSNPPVKPTPTATLEPTETPTEAPAATPEPTPKAD